MEAGVAAGLHCPSVGWSASEGEPPSPGRFRPRPCGPGRSLRFLTGQVRIGPCGSRALPCGRPRFPGGIERLRLSASTFVSLSDSGEAKLLRCPFAKPSARGLPVSPDPRWKVGSASACASASRFSHPVARATLRSASVRRHPPLSAGPRLRASLPLPEGRALPQEEKWQRNPSRAKHYFGDSACG